MVYRRIPDVSNPRDVANIPDNRPRSFTTVVMDNANPFQTNFLGIGANYMGFAAFPELGLSGAQQTAEFDRAYTSGIKIARTWYGQDWACGNPYGAADWTTAKMTAFYTWMAAMQSRGINVVLTMGWHFPGNVAAPSLGSIPLDTPTPAQETAWAAWVSDSLQQLINVRGYTNIVACFFFTEPNDFGSIPVGYTAQEYYVYLVTKARTKIAADDAGRTPILPRVLIMGAEEHSTTNDDWVEYCKTNAPTVFDAYTAHSYCTTPTFAPLGLSASSCPGYTAWNALFANWVGDSSPAPFWADEVNTLTGGDTESNGYRLTADAGMQLCRWIDGHVQAGAQASIFWMLQDQHWVGSSYQQQYGIAKWIGDSNAVKPSWYAVSMLANLTGGGSGTKVHRASSGTTSTLHVTGYFIPYGVRNTVNASGEWTWVVINEGTAVGLDLDLTTSLGGRTVYRYTYSGEIPPTAASNPAYLLPWDQRYTGVTTEVPHNIIPGHSVVCFSTMAVNSPASENLALQANASTDSTGFGNAWNVVDGNFTNVIGAANGWRKSDDSSHYVQLSWTNVVSISRLEVAFAGTTAGVVYATYTDTTSPTVLADYTVQYLNASGVWTSLVSVSGNTSPNKTHTFATIQTSAIRMNVTSAAASANVNQIGVYET